MQYWTISTDRVIFGCNFKLMIYSALSLIDKTRTELRDTLYMGSFLLSHRKICPVEYLIFIFLLQNMDIFFQWLTLKFDQ